MQAFHFIGVARWLAALAVLIGHLGNLFICQLDIMSAPHALGAYAWWFLAGFSHEAVIVFFVISGYLVGGNAIERSRRLEPYLAKYFVDRVVRIYLVFLPIILIGSGFDILGKKLFGGFGLYGTPFFVNNFNLSLLGANLLNLQGIVVPAFGSNGPLWSLGCEFWYYVIWALLLLPLTRAAPVVRFAGFVCGTVLAVTFSICDLFFLVGGIIWITGALTRFVPQPLLKSKTLALVVFLSVTVAVRLITAGQMPSAALWLTDGAVAISFSNLLLSMRHSTAREWTFCRWRLHAFFSDFSYSLYVCHMPILVFGASAANYAWGWYWRAEAPTALHWAVTFGLLIITFCSAWLFSRFTEAHTDTVRHLVYRSLKMPAREAEPIVTLNRRGVWGMVRLAR